MDTTVFDSLIAVLARRMDMEKIEKTDDDLCMLEFGDVVVCFRFLHARREHPDFFRSGAYAGNGQGSLFQAVLEANHALFETAGATFPSIHRWIWWPCNISVRRKRRTNSAFSPSWKILSSWPDTGARNAPSSPRSKFRMAEDGNPGGQDFLLRV